MRFITNNKNKGFTLIEVIIAILITISLSSITLSLSKNFKRLDNKLKGETTVNEIINFINTCKLYCKNNNKDALLVEDFENNEMYLQIDIKKTIKYVLPKGIYFYGRIANGNISSISKNGSIGSAGKITFKDLDGNLYKVITNVGVSNVYSNQT